VGFEDGISREDLLRSLDGPSWTARAKSAERIAELYRRGGLDGATRRIAEDAFRVLRWDGEALVRRLLAECLKDAAGLPRDIAMTLATDKAEIATPFLVHSPSLSDRDLIAVVVDNTGPHRIAIARRKPLSATVADALCRCGEDEATLAVLANDEAVVEAETLHWLLDREPLPEGLTEAITRRKLLPIGIGERLRGALRPLADARSSPSCGRAAI